jgi:DNA-binding GntR family transcriptional regulator
MRTHAIYEVLRDRICWLDYPPGTRLGEVELAAEFGVSRTPIRSVLARLEAEGLVDVRRGVGSMVTEIDLPTLMQTLELRQELTMVVARLTPGTGIGGILPELQAILGDTDKVADAAGFARLNARYFEAMLGLTENRPFREVARRLYYMTARLWVHASARLDLADELAHFRRELGEVIAALERGDLEAVGHVRWLHLAASAERLRLRSSEAPRQVS